MANLKDLERTCYIYPRVELNLEDFPHQGLILPIAGGGEGVIGQLKGEAVIANDYQEEELQEAADSPLKVYYGCQGVEIPG